MTNAKILNVRKVQGKKIRLSTYTHIRAFHASREEDERLFHIHGIKPYSKKEALSVAIRKLVSEGLCEAEIETKFNELWTDVSHSKVWLMLEKDELLEGATHYLIYGSELLSTLAMHLDCRDKLKKIGLPIIVECNVPIADVSSVWLSGLEQDIENGCTTSRSISVDFVLPENVFRISHPAGWVRDPFSRKLCRLG